MHVHKADSGRVATSQNVIATDRVFVMSDKLILVAGGGGFIGGHLVARLRAGGWKLLDCQFITPHLASMGAIEISQADYLTRLYSVLSEGAGVALGSGAGRVASAGGLAPADAGLFFASSAPAVAFTASSAIFFSSSSLSSENERQPSW